MASSAPSVRISELWPAEIPVLKEIPPPSKLCVPVGMGGLIKKTRVRAGDALTGGDVKSSHVPLAPMAGELGEVSLISRTNGRSVRTVELKVSDGSPAEQLPPFGEGLGFWIDHLRATGVNADRHCSPDLIGQLDSILSNPIDRIICTILDTDAALRLSGILAARYAEDIVAGVDLLMDITDAKKATIAVEAFATPGWIKPVRTAAKQTDIRLVELENDYPQADPTLILYTLSNRRLRPGQLPTDQGVLLIDAAAAMAIGAARRGQKMLHVPIAIHNHMTRTSHFLWVPIGTTLDYALAQCEIADEQIILRAGDLLRDRRIEPDAVIGAGELTFHAAPMELPANPEPCIRSGWCIDICPTRVQPAKILEAAQHDNNSMAEKAGIHACIECGLCNHVCPSRLPLLDAIRMMRVSGKE